MLRTPLDVTDAELAVLELLWDVGSSSVRQMAETPPMQLFRNYLNDAKIKDASSGIVTAGTRLYFNDQP